MCNNIEIVSFYMDENNDKMLKSKYYQMDNYLDYKELQNEIQKIANCYDVNLQE